MAATILHFRAPVREPSHLGLDGELQNSVLGWLTKTLAEILANGRADDLPYGDKALIRSTIKTMDAIGEPDTITLKKLLWSMEALLGLRNRLLAAEA